MQPVVPKQTACKCCGASASLYGVVDFNKNCEILRKKVFDVSGIPIYYYRCPACEFLFTTAFDHFTPEDFQRHIYNSDYTLIDPDSQDYRPRSYAALLCHLFPNIKPKRILDYGCGAGLLADLLRATGQFQVDSFDPFVSQHSTLPKERYDCIVSFEVFEHSTDPARTMAEIKGLLEEPGMILFATLFQPADMDQQGLGWWYAGPRNGHVSLYSRASFLKLIEPYGFRLASCNADVHVLFRQVPEFAKHFITPRSA